MHTKGVTGVLAYQAIELFQGGKFTTAVDIWALGCILYEMIHYDKLFANDTEDENQLALLSLLMEKIRKHEHQPFNESCPTNIKELILKCIDPEPWKRPTVLELLDESMDLKAELEIVAEEKRQKGAEELAEERRKFEEAKKVEEARQAEQRKQIEADSNTTKEEAEKLAEERRKFEADKL